LLPVDFLPGLIVGCAHTLCGFYALLVTQQTPLPSAEQKQQLGSKNFRRKKKKSQLANDCEMKNVSKVRRSKPSVLQQ